jgi:CPA2 family monovalent cation:H+ antiporter-2
LTKHEIEIQRNSTNEVILKQIELKNELYLAKHRQSKLRAINGLVAGIERNGKRLLNPESNIVFKKMIFYGL